MIDAFRFILYISKMITTFLLRFGRAQPSRQISSCRSRLSCRSAPRGAADEKFLGGGRLAGTGEETETCLFGQTFGKTSDYYWWWTLKLKVIENFMFEREAHFESKYVLVCICIMHWIHIYIYNTCIYIPYIYIYTYCYISVYESINPPFRR